MQHNACVMHVKQYLIMQLIRTYMHHIFSTHSGSLYVSQIYSNFIACVRVIGVIVNKVVPHDLLENEQNYAFHPCIHTLLQLGLVEEFEIPRTHSM